ncbi:DUF1304 domain-containing protein [Compostimonas suwonensis]|uniref:Putative membrane protein n=1 Tax=Compostimonas suwonensis TaxID=1048394 RepID=A0A2M9C3X6_9MICO|nr:DUF1304 domain-containing protein [Compostimonas suwonensis]PJJ65226.1 putative membrane protein [Compostimonas suwonensis]
MIILATVVVTLAAVIHVAIFAMESISWAKPSVWKRFGVKSQAQADTVRPMAYNQGFYNLFLAIGAFIGVILVGAGAHEAGGALVIFTVGSMLAASIVLITSGRGYIRAALIQGTVPLIALVLFIISLVS